MTDLASTTFAYAADQACWGAAAGSVRHYAMLQGLEVGFVERSGELVTLTVSGPSAILGPFMRRTEACFGEAVRTPRTHPEGPEIFRTLPAPSGSAGTDHG